MHRMTHTFAKGVCSSFVWHSSCSETGCGYAPRWVHCSKSAGDRLYVGSERFPRGKAAAELPESLRQRCQTTNGDRRSPASPHVDDGNGNCLLVARGLGQAGWIRTGIAIGNHPALGNGRRNRSGPLRLTSPAGAGRSAREAPASGCPRTATRCCRAASSPLRSSRCAFGSGRTPRCRRERGSHARPPTD